MERTIGNFHQQSKSNFKAIKSILFTLLKGIPTVPERFTIFHNVKSANMVSRKVMITNYSGFLRCQSKKSLEMKTLVFLILLSSMRMIRHE